ncbi:hypothetical protein DFJ58DRAFT_840397 [Suillus subalutaceus]|uniref:uncharacterized protein n=1 Tax=Suillus subalutaceus TaxID=48586 RepID=UPI001B85E773|nr:uncharacterized protein DFJ58DRAFT_840397 [Suillus subalutaceus]KAG1858356.1 hypothetical protein DFJ58DRAFT_840397 [Suillus subalutaceus]
MPHDLSLHWAFMGHTFLSLFFHPLPLCIVPHEKPEPRVFMGHGTYFGMSSQHTLDKCITPPRHHLSFDTGAVLCASASTTYSRLSGEDNTNRKQQGHRERGKFNQFLSPEQQAEPFQTDPLQIADEQVWLDLEEAVWSDEHLDSLMTSCLEDFPDDDVSKLADYAAGIARSSIIDRTRDGHARIIKAYIVFHKQRNAEWGPTTITRQTPYDIRAFITHKCGEKDKGYEGKKFSTAVSTRAALSYWYWHCRPNESVTEWRCDEKTSVCTHTPEERRWGVVRYTAYLFAWLMLLRIEEVVTLEFTSVEVIPGERAYIEVRLKTRKSAQTGVLHTWHLWVNDADARLCPVRALIRLASLYGPHKLLKGSLFLRIGKLGDVLHDQPVSTSILSHALTSDLQGLAYSSWALYGTHSFRRGGCQHRIRNCGFDVSMVAAWGGWSQVEALTMFRYFYSPNDNHEHMVEYDRNDKKRVKF